MDPEFWLQRWREGRTGFHRDAVLPLLALHWDTLGLRAGSRVFVPLAGKSLDMLWLASRGHRVLGVELSPLAVAQFFEGNGLPPVVETTRYGTHYRAGTIELIQGDAFGLDAAALEDCEGVYDRAALIALPPPLRARYVSQLYASLPEGCRGLLVTLEYPPHEKAGPPFAVDAAEVRQRFGPRWDIELLERRDILHAEPGFVAEGVTALATAAWRLRHRGGARPA
jgi:thiopurine S-methyltransferase